MTVDYATSDGTALAGNNYTATSGTLTFGEGVTSQTITVPLINQTNYTTLTFTATLSNPTGDAILATPTACTVSVVDDATPLFPVVMNAITANIGTITTP